VIDVVIAREVAAVPCARRRTNAKRNRAGRPAGPYSPTSRRLARSVLRRALRYAEAEGLVSRNAAAIAHGLKLERAKGRAMTPEQAVRSSTRSGAIAWRPRPSRC
jgi:hypothetical protein